MKLRRLSRVEYTARPSQFVRRAWRILRCAINPGILEVRLPWGFTMAVNPRESVGRAIVALDMHDLLVTEAQWRLTDPGETCADVGANIGFASSVFAHRLRQGGTVWCFEPLPEIAEQLAGNIQRWRSLTEAQLKLWPVALSSGEGTQNIYIPERFAENQGTASLEASATTAGRRIAIETCRLDSLGENSRRFGVMKVDVEGAEAQVFEGAAGLLATGRIRDIIFEEHRPAPARSIELLLGHGYNVWRVGRGPRGPQLLPCETPVSTELDPPTYLGTLAPERARTRFEPEGWQSLRA